MLPGPGVCRVGEFIESSDDSESEDAVFERTADVALACFLAWRARTLEVRLQHPIDWAARVGV